VVLALYTRFFCVPFHHGKIYNPQKFKACLVDQISLFGNMAPHLHWHVIPRFVGDAHFPNPVWGKRQRSGKTGMAKHTPANWRTALRDQLVRLL
jgi:diadenosine tetraphosphate (Ap4A) HIT family hydrolase